MNILVFSKDRACQLELFLSSFKKFFKNYQDNTINILYTFSNENFERGYKKVIDLYPEFNFVKETIKFKDHIITLIKQSEKYTIFFVDDIVFKREFDINTNEFKKFEEDSSICCLSLRLDPTLTYCYAADIKMSKPPMIDNVWNWIGQSGDFGYPMSVDGHIFRTNQIYTYLIMLNYNNPNSLEGLMAIQPLPLPKMICYSESILFNNPINKVQTNNPNRFGDITAEFLNEKFLDNYRIKLDKFINFKNIGCHQLVDLEFEKII